MMRQRQTELQQRRPEGGYGDEAKGKAPQGDLFPLLGGNKRSLFMGVVVLLLLLLLGVTVFMPEDKGESVLASPSNVAGGVKAQGNTVNVDSLVRKGPPHYSDEGGGRHDARAPGHHPSHGSKHSSESAQDIIAQLHQHHPQLAPEQREESRSQHLQGAGHHERGHAKHQGSDHQMMVAEPHRKSERGRSRESGDNEVDVDDKIDAELENMARSMNIPMGPPEDGEDGDDDNEQEFLDGEGRPQDLDDEDDEEAEFAHHIDDEEEPDDDTLEDMSDAMFDEMDVNKDQQISWPEFWAVTSRENPDASKEEEKELFSSIDHNQDGYIDKEELRKDWKRDDLQFLTGGKLDADDDMQTDLDREEQRMSDQMAADESKVMRNEMISKMKQAAEENLQRGRGPKPASDSSGKTLGQTISETALKLFKQRAPKPRTLSVKLFQAPVATWSQADRQCKKTRQRICPSAVVEQMRLCEDRDPHHKNRWVPLSENGHWLDLKLCRVVEKPHDMKVAALVACC